eukprot:CAMPEP_0116017996 /NCGR_PEP_ID=MMETSP0321-20121206/8387_1 /TAXON_ID=163516 /ORGANISM="Leptocylindrus danicus var. danicus, Strain B650" /LENGTH=66 /DNA_ID=CAMNT_0003488309 /DNA_START=192 /DNA_END=388 /DNA_ORIENTATION=+
MNYRITSAFLLSVSAPTTVSAFLPTSKKYSTTTVVVSSNNNAKKLVPFISSTTSIAAVVDIREEAP